MLVFLMPKGVARVISSTQRWFIWDGISDGKKFCKVSWNVIVRAKDKGGLGMVSLQGKNKAMLFKWLLGLGDNNLGEWQDFVHTTY